VALAYDELPAGSDLRREYRGDGAVTITSPAGEPSTAVRRSAAQRQALASALFTCVVMAGSLWALWPQFTRLDAALRATVLGLLVVVIGGVFLLAWRVWYGADLDLLTKARREAVVLHADARGLLVEIAGPLGDRSIEVPANSLGRISVVGWRLGAVVIPHLKLEQHGEPTLLLFAGRHRGELDWIAATLRQVLRQDEA
jgi:hypothetical protein